MASLRRLDNSPFFIACLTLSGRRTNRSTKTSDRRLAQRLADEWQDAADKARQGAFVEAQARKILNECLAHAGQDPIPAETTEAFLLRWVAGKGDCATGRRYATTVEQFLSSLNGKRTAQISTVGHQDVLGFIEKREQAGVAPKTLSVDIHSLGAGFNLARKLGLITVNPVERALAIRPIAIASSRRECFTSEQIAKLVEAAEGDWKTAVLLGYFTGARLSDCCNMQWANVDLAAPSPFRTEGRRGVIDFLPQKTRRKNKRVVVPLHPNLAAHLEQMPSSDLPQAFLCPSLAGKPSCGKNGLSGQFKRIMDKAGIDTQTGAGLGIRRFAKLSFHSLRHSFNSALANAGIDQETRMRLTGHASAAVNGDYTHLELPNLRAAVEKMPGLANSLPDAEPGL